MRGIVEIISIFCLNPVNVELEQARIRIDETKDLSPCNALAPCHLFKFLPKCFII